MLAPSHLLPPSQPNQQPVSRAPVCVGSGNRQTFDWLKKRKSMKEMPSLFGIERRMSKQLVLNRDQASVFVGSIEDREVRNVVAAALAHAWVLVLPHETLDGHPVAPLTPAQPIDLLFVAKRLAEVFARKQTMIDILSGSETQKMRSCD